MGRGQRAVYALLVLAILAVGYGRWRDVLTGDDDGRSTDEAEPVSDVDDPDGSAPSSTLALHRRDYATGDCVSWDQEPGGGRRNTRVVPCREPHLIEITGETDIEADGYPSESGWLSLMEQHCDPLATEHLGHPLDPYGRFTLGMVFPFEDSWRQGDRVLECGLILADGSQGAAAWTPFTGEVGPQALESRYGPGDCIADGQSNRVVPCTESHHWEVVGVVTISDGIDQLPTSEDLGALVKEDCRALAQDYLGRPIDPGLFPIWHEPAQESWDAGQRNVPCSIGRYEGEAPVAVTGSLKG